MVTRIRSGTASSSFEHSAWARSSARHAETSLRASSRTFPSMLAEAARAQAIVPLPATAGSVYGSGSVTRPGSYHAGAYPACMQEQLRRPRPWVGVRPQASWSR